MIRFGMGTWGEARGHKQHPSETGRKHVCACRSVLRQDYQVADITPTIKSPTSRATQFKKSSRVVLLTPDKLRL